MTEAKRVPKAWLACAQHPDGGSCFVLKDGHHYVWCYECRGPFAVEREDQDQPDYGAVRRHLESALAELGNEANDGGSEGDHAE